VQTLGDRVNLRADSITVPKSMKAVVALSKLYEDSSNFADQKYVPIEPDS